MMRGEGGSPVGSSRTWDNNSGLCKGSGNQAATRDAAISSTLFHVITEVLFPLVAFLLRQLRRSVRPPTLLQPEMIRSRRYAAS
jgi:hypothetical protein